MPIFESPIEQRPWAAAAARSRSHGTASTKVYANGTAHLPQQRGIALRALISMVAILLCTGCESPTPLPPQKMVAPTQTSLAAGDVVRFSFIGVPELTGSQKIRADGKLTMPLIGEVQAAGKKPFELQSDLVRLYKSQLKNSEVVVTLESGATQVYLSGAVKTPGKLTLEKPMTVFEAIMEVGGFVDFSDPGRVRVIHLKNGEHRADVIDLRPALKGMPTRAYYVSPGDVIYVPVKIFNF